MAKEFRRSSGAGASGPESRPDLSTATRPRGSLPATASGRSRALGALGLGSRSGDFAFKEQSEASRSRGSLSPGAASRLWLWSGGRRPRSGVEGLGPGFRHRSSSVFCARSPALRDYGLSVATLQGRSERSSGAPPAEDRGRRISGPLGCARRVSRETGWVFRQRRRRRGGRSRPADGPFRQEASAEVRGSRGFPFSSHSW